MLTLWVLNVYDLTDLTGVFFQCALIFRYEVRHTGGIVMAGFCAFAPILWTCSSDESACVWDARSGALVQKYTGHKDVVLGCCAVKDDSDGNALGYLIATASDDRECRIFGGSGGSGGESKTL